MERGGAELQVVQLASALRGRGYEVGLFALRRGPLADTLPLHHLYRFRPHVLHSHLFHANLAARLAGLFLPVPAVISTVHSLAESSRRTGRIRLRDLSYHVTDAFAGATVFVSTAAAIVTYRSARSPLPART